MCAKCVLEHSIQSALPTSISSFQHNNLHLLVLYFVGVGVGTDVYAGLL